MLYIKDIKLLQNGIDPWMEALDINMNYVPEAEPQLEFDFSRSCDKDNASTKQHTTVINNNKNITFTELPELSSELPEIPFDEQLLSPQEKMSCNDDILYDSPLINFEDDFIQLSKKAETFEQDIKESYKAGKPMPNTFIDYHTEQLQSDSIISDDSFLCVKADICSQKSDNMAIYSVESELIVDKSNNSDSCHVEHNYTSCVQDSSINDEIKVKEKKVNININNQINNNQRKVPTLKIRIPRQVNANQDVISTPEITNQIIELEKDFDFMSYINTNNVKCEVVGEDPEAEQEDIKPVVESHKRKSSISIDELKEHILNEPKRRYGTRTRASSPCTSYSSEYINPSSVQSSTSDESTSTDKPTKKRGRPPKPVASLLNLSEFSKLSPEDLRYREQRNKNNEASRRSRLNRRSKEQQLEEEAQQLEQEYRFLEIELNRMTRKCEKWRTAVKELALL